MRKSSYVSRRYRPGTSTNRMQATTFRDQMAEYAKGAVLRELRAKTGLSRERVAAEIDVTTKSLYSWENDGGIKRAHADRLAKFYGVEDPGTLVRRTEEAGDQLDRLEAKLDAIIAHLGIRTITPSEVADVVEAEAQRHVERRSRSGKAPGNPRRSAAS